MSLLPLDRFSGVKRRRDSSAGSVYLALGISLDWAGAESGGSATSMAIAEARSADS